MFGLSKSRRAFTIVELLVVISIIGVLIGMLLPAVQAARESGRRAQCLNNMKQLGIGVLHYESKANYLPNNLGWGDAGADEGQNENTNGYSWITQILPYIEGETIYNRIKMDEKLSYKDPAPNGILDNLRAAQQKITLLSCPTDTDTRITTDSLMYSTRPNPAVGSTNYKACCGANWLHSVDLTTLEYKLAVPVPPTPPPPTIITSKTYEGRHKNLDLNDGRDNGNGIICRNYINTSTNPNGKPILTAMLDIRDGSSHTFAIGEVIVANSNYNGWYWFNGTTATCQLPLNFSYKKNPGIAAPDANHWEYTYGFSSQHAVGANFCMADGSARFVPNNIDLALYQAMATINAGELVSDSD
jgi:prepilin-type N-terminal cleavage/methylation domain-containing protein/prepilin-type processing-associated H-X9-DG protein